MKRTIITLFLLLAMFLFALLSSKSNILGWDIRPAAAVGEALGRMLGGFLLGMLAVFLLKKMETKNQQRLLIAVFFILYGLLWKVSYTAEARRSCVQVVEQTIAEMQYSSGEQAE